MAKKTLRAEDIERLQADLDLLEKALAVVRAHSLDAMDRVAYRTGWGLMKHLWKAQEYVSRAKWALEDITPQSTLPPSYMAPDMVNDWLRKGVDGPQSHEGEQGHV